MPLAAPTVKPIALLVEEYQAVMVAPAVCARNRLSHSGRMPVQFGGAPVRIVITEQLGGGAITFDQYLFVGEPDRRLFVESGQHRFDESQRDTRQPVVDSQEAHRRAAQGDHDRLCGGSW